MKSNINLHIHTTHSDGGKSIAEVVDGLRAAGVEYFSITDHDAVEGNVEAAELAKKHGMKHCNGVELSCCFADGEIGLDGSYVCHIVGLDFDLEKMRTELKKFHAVKSQKIIDLTKALITDGYKIDEKSILESLDVKRREKIGKELIANGYAQDMNEAFEKILNSARYVEYARNVPSIKEAIEIIHRCEGLAVWPHPFGVMRGGKKELTEGQVSTLAKIMASYGIDGMEVFYQHYTVGQIKFLESLAREHMLPMSTGTDYHGSPSDKNSDPAYAAKVCEQLFFEKDVEVEDGIEKVLLERKKK